MVVITTKGKIEGWKLVPMKHSDHPGAFAVVGTINGKQWTTSAVEKYHMHQGRRFMATEQGSVYELGKESDTLWRLPFQLRRPEQTQKLTDAGFLT